MKNPIFENTLKIDESLYASIWKLKRRRLYRIIIVASVGVLCLFSTYTLIIGILLIILSALGFIMPKVGHFGIKENWNGHKYLHQTLKYSIGADGIAVRGETISAELGWPLLVTWRIIGDWLILSPSGGPQVFFPVSKMQSDGVFDDIMKLVQKYGREFK